MINPIKAVKAFVSANSNVPKKLDYTKWDKYVRINNSLDSDVFNYVSGLKSTLGNYAKKEGLRIDIYPASKEIKDNASYEGSNIARLLGKRIAVKVEDSSFGRSKINLFENTLKGSKEEPSLARQIFQMVGGSKKVGQHEAVEGVKETIAREFGEEFFRL